jgi:hypothetical protein
MNAMTATAVRRSKKMATFLIDAENSIRFRCEVLGGGDSGHYKSVKCESLLA